MQSSDPPLPHYLRILRRQAWLIWLVVAATLGATALLLQTQKPIYRGAMTIVVGEPRGEAAPVLGSHSVARTMTNLLESDLLARTVIRRLDLDVSTEKFLKDLSVTVLPDTAVLAVSYDSTDPKQSVAVLRQLATAFRREVDQTLGVRKEGAAPAGSFSLIVRMFDPPHLEPKAIERNAPRTLAFAGGLGLVLGLLLAVARDGLDARIRGRREAEESFGAPVVGALSRLSRQPLAAARTGRGGRASERRTARLDLLRARLQFAQMGIGGPTILVSSAGGDEDSTGVAAHLAVAFARAGKRVVCVDADLRSPGMERYVPGEHDRPGLADVVANGAVLQDALIPVAFGTPSPTGNGQVESPGQLEVLRAGSSERHPAETLTSEAVSALAQQLRERADFIIVDAPPLLAAETIPLALNSDSVLIVARHGRTTRDQADSVRATLAGLGISKVGVVLTDTPAD